MLAARGVALGGVGDLVANHAGEFVLAIDQGQQPAGDVDIAAREREGVGSRLVDDMKGVIKGPGRGEGEHPFSDDLDIGLEFRVIDDSHLGRHPLGGLGAHIGIIEIRGEQNVLGGVRLSAPTRAADRANENQPQGDG